jgi:hypothetical protein
MQQDTAKMQEGAQVGAMIGAVDALRWRAKWTLEKRVGDWTGEQIKAGLAPDPYEKLDFEGNLLMYGGASCLWQCLVGNGVGTAGQALTFFNNGNAAIGVGDSNASEVATHTDLQAATNKLRKAMEATYPIHADGTGSGAASIAFRSVFGSGDANWAWAEWGTFNSPTAATGRMLNRKVQALGTKAAGTTWTLTVTLTLA